MCTVHSSEHSLDVYIESRRSLHEIKQTQESFLYLESLRHPFLRST